MFRRLIERLRRRLPRGRRIRVQVVGSSRVLSCPMLGGLYRPASACQQCEYSLGLISEGRISRQICGFGIKAPRQLPAWLSRLWNVLKCLRLPRGYVRATFQRKPKGERPLSRIQKRHRDRLLRIQQQRELRRRLLRRRKRPSKPSTRRPLPDK